MTNNFFFYHENENLIFHDTAINYGSLNEDEKIRLSNQGREIAPFMGVDWADFRPGMLVSSEVWRKLNPDYDLIIGLNKKYLDKFIKSENWRKLQYNKTAVKSAKVNKKLKAAQVELNKFMLLTIAKMSGGKI